MIIRPAVDSVFAQDLGFLLSAYKSPSLSSFLPLS